MTFPDTSGIRMLGLDLEFMLYFTGTQVLQETLLLLATSVQMGKPLTGSSLAFQWAGQ